MKREQTVVPFVPIRLIIENQREKEVLMWTERSLSSDNTEQIAKNLSVDVGEVENILARFRELLNH